MKGDYVKEEKDNHNSNPMFASKLHHTQSFLHHPPPPPPSQPTTTSTLLHSSFQISEEVDSHHRHSSPSATTPKTQQTLVLTPPSSAGINDGATIEVVRRPRGRPPGSKNKPKPPVIITREAEPSMSPYVLEISSGVDILESVTTFCRKRRTGLCILNGSGTVSNVTLRQPSTTPGASVTFHGRFDILSLSATILPPTSSLSLTSPALSNGIANGFTISLAGPQGQVVGGTVVGSLYTAGTVYLIAASFNSPSFYRLPLQQQEEDQRNNSAGGGGGGGSEGPSSISGDGGVRSPPVESCSGGAVPVSMYSCHLPSDVIWAPTARQPPPQQQQQNPPPHY